VPSPPLGHGPSPALGHGPSPPLGRGPSPPLGRGPSPHFVREFLLLLVTALSSSWPSPPLVLLTTLHCFFLCFFPFNLLSSCSIFYELLLCLFRKYILLFLLFSCLFWWCAIFLFHFLSLFHLLFLYLFLSLFFFYYLSIYFSFL
jgi:hypothetical protein